MNKEKDLALQLQAIIEAAIDGIITIDNKGYIKQINPAGAKMFEYEPYEVIGQKINMLMPTRYAQDHDTYLTRYQQTRIPRIIGIGREVSGLKKSGIEFPFRLAVSEVVLHNQVIYTGIIHDLSEIKKAETQVLKINKELELKVEQRTAELEAAVNRLLSTNKSLTDEIEHRQRITQELLERELELQQSLEKEKELNELKSRFVSMASHEFRTPLTSILSSAVLISKYPLADQQSNREKHIERIKSAVGNLTGILNDFLSLSKLEEGKIELSTHPFDLVKLCKETIEEVKSLNKMNQVIVLNITQDHIEVTSDERIIKNILFNLISNAIKYSEDQIDLTVHYKDNSINIVVKDRGIGIPEEDQKHLFTRFFRASNAINIQGTGLGLNIVRRYVEILHGQLSFESTQGEGTSFFVTIPSN